jgi:hypothetical protein
MDFEHIAKTLQHLLQGNHGVFLNGASSVLEPYIDSVGSAVITNQEQRAAITNHKHTLIRRVSCASRLAGNFLLHDGGMQHVAATASLQLPTGAINTLSQPKGRAVERFDADGLRLTSSCEPCTVPIMRAAPLHRVAAATSNESTYTAEKPNAT